MKDLMTTLKDRVPDGLYSFVTEWKRHRRSRSYLARYDRLYDQIGRPTRVAAGPFRDMTYHGRAVGSMILPKVLGTYEIELAPAIEAIIADRPELIVDVGSAEGYYAVGFARILPNAKVLAYDTDRYARVLTSKLAAINGVAERVGIRGECEPRELERTIGDVASPVVICDCEGYEDELLDLNLAPSLARATILVEMHEVARPGVAARIRARFAATHDITTIPTVPRLVADCPIQTPLAEDELLVALDECRRGPMEWDFMRPRSGVGKV